MHAVQPLALPLQAIDIRELPRPPKGRAAPPAVPWRELLAPALAGQDIGLISEAGLPAVADPGAAAVAIGLLQVLSGQRLDSLVVGDHANFTVHSDGVAIEQFERLARLGPARPIAVRWSALPALEDDLAIGNRDPRADVADPELHVSLREGAPHPDGIAVTRDGYGIGGQLQEGLGESVWVDDGQAARSGVHLPCPRRAGRPGPARGRRRGTRTALPGRGHPGAS